MDKIYSRKRIRFPKIKRKKYKIMNFLIILMILIIILAIVSFISASYPIFIASCKSASVSQATNIITDEVNSVMNNYDYNDLITVEKDENGNVTLMKANVVLMNKIIATITKNIQVRIDNSPTTMVYINYGSVSRD